MGRPRTEHQVDPLLRPLIAALERISEGDWAWVQSWAAPSPAWWCSCSDEAAFFVDGAPSFGPPVTWRWSAGTASPRRPARQKADAPD
jgi:hypothetical protein